MRTLNYIQLVNYFPRDKEQILFEAWWYSQQFRKYFNNFQVVIQG